MSQPKKEEKSENSKESTSYFSAITNLFNPKQAKPSKELVKKAVESDANVRDTTAQKVENAVESVSQNNIDTVESNFRYFAYLARYKSLLVASSRYLAYTSDVGEAFRPLVRPAIVTGAYAVSWAYLVGDVSWEGYKAWKIQNDPTTVGGMMVKRAIFQAIASMALPAFTIHSVVKYSGKAVKGSSNPFVRTWVPTILGLGTVPALPFMFDHPTEKAVDWVWEEVEERFFGKTHSVDKTPALFPGDPKYATGVVDKAEKVIAQNEAKSHKD